MNYEGLFILKPDLEKEELDQLYQKISDSIKKHKGEAEGAAEEWGKRRLAYKIKRYKEGLFCLFRFKMEPSQIAQFNSELKLNESIIRMAFTKPSRIRAGLRQRLKSQQTDSADSKNG